MTEKQFFELRLKDADTAKLAYGRFRAYLANNHFHRCGIRGHEFYCRFRLMVGRSCTGGCGSNTHYGYYRSLHPVCPDRDHDRWFKDDNGGFIYTIQPFIANATPELRTKNLAEIKSRHEAFAAKEGLLVRVSDAESWWCPEGTVLIEYRSNRWWEIK
jgi:hypothetical protein